MRFHFHGSLAPAGETRPVDCVDRNLKDGEQTAIKLPFRFHCQVRVKDIRGACTAPRVVEHQAAVARIEKMNTGDLNPLFASMLQYMLKMDAVVEGVRDLSDKIDYCQERAELWSRKVARLGPHRVRG